MGIFLRFTVAPERISQDQWEKVYEEALGIVRASDLLDCVVLERNGLEYPAGRKTEERNFSDKGLGIRISGTMASGCDMESFYLFRRKPCCPSGAPDNGADILFGNWYSEDPDIPVPTGTCMLWNDKTQGCPGHIPLLAIACLFAHRFPDAVGIGGDILAGQCRAAVRLANQYLERPIQTPVTCRAEALVQRLRKPDLPIQKQLAAFFQLYLGRLTPEIGRVLKESFPKEELYRYFLECMAQKKPGTEAFPNWMELRDYLLLELELNDLLKMLAQDAAGPRLPLESLLSGLFECKVHIPLEQKTCANPGGLDPKVNGDKEEPLTIESLMGMAFFAMMAGRNRNLPVYLPLERIRDACRQVFPDRDTDALIDRLLAEPTVDERQEKAYGNDDNAIYQKLHTEAEKEWNRIIPYDLREPKDLHRWKPGLTIEPTMEQDLLAFMRKIRTFSNEQEYQKFLNSDRAERESDFIRRRQILIYETTWNHIFSRIMDDAYIYRYYLLFKVDTSPKSVFDVMDALLSNPPLIDMLWERSAEEAAGETD